MDKLTQVLTRAPIFGGLATEDLRALMDIAAHQFYARGRTIFMEGDEGRGFYVLVDGKVKIFKVSTEGKEQILHIYGPGATFGEVPVFSGRRFPANAQALVKSHALFFPRAGFVNLIRDNPFLAMNMLAIFSRRLREFVVHIENLSLKEVPGRLASYLLYASDEQQTPGQLMLTISKGQLASLLGTIPETLSRIFAKMSSQGLIDVAGRTITLLDRQGLNDLSVSGKLID